jgi:hypothetical protein
MNLLDIGNDFLSHTPIAGVSYEHNEYVYVVGGAYAGESGSLVCVHTLSADPAFVLEAESGRDIVVLQSHLSRVAV